MSQGEFVKHQELSAIEESKGYLSFDNLQDVSGLSFIEKDESSYGLSLIGEGITPTDLVRKSCLGNLRICCSTISYGNEA